MEDDSSGALHPRWLLRKTLLTAAGVFTVLSLASLLGPGAGAADGAGTTLTLADGASPAARAWYEILTPGVLVGTLVLLGLSGFFSASEIAFFSLHKLQIRSMSQSTRAPEKLVALLMLHPGNLLTSILMGNSIVNVLLSVILASPVEQAFLESANLHPAAAYTLSLIICTAVLVFFGEVLPKVVVVRQSEAFARTASMPIFLADRILHPLRNIILWFIGVFFRVTRFSQVRPAPFITDDEFLSLLSEGEATGAIEKDERQMIEGILEFSDVTLREVLIPRPDILAIKETATVQEALELVREQEISRIPVYRDNLDQISGVLYAKDLLAVVDAGELDRPVKPLLRKAHFVPETMTIADFVKDVQRHRVHLAIVVDEYGGTEGMITLHDALREVVGDIGEEDEEEEVLVVKIQEGLYRVDGGLSLDELEELTGVPVDDEEHATVGGFIMDRAEKIPEPGDRIECTGVIYTVEAVDGRRITQLRVQVPPKPTQVQES